MSRNDELYRQVFRWSDLPEETVRPGVRRHAYATDDVMLVLNWLSPGMELNPHVHEEFDQLAVVLAGEANYYIDDVPYAMGPGSMLLVPAGSPHYIEPLEGVEGEIQNLDIFVPPRADLLHLLGYLDSMNPDAAHTSG